MAMGGFVLSVLSQILAYLGTFGPAPFGAIRIPFKALEGAQALLVYGGTFIFPILLGLLGAGLGAYSFQSIDRSGGHLKGNAAAVFAVLLGLFSVVISTIGTFAVLIYPLIY